MAATSLLWAGDRPPTEVLELKDTELINRLWETIHPDSSPTPPGEYQILLPAPPENSIPGSESDPGAYLLRNGTTEGRLERGAWEQAAEFSRKEKVVRWKDDWEEPESEYIPTVWQALNLDLERLIGWTEWPAGLHFKLGTGMSLVPSSKPQYERQMDFVWNQKLFRHFLLGAALHRTEFGGGLVRFARSSEVEELPLTSSALPDSNAPSFWTDPYWWWSLSFGVPAARYTLYLANRPLPELYWLETRSKSLIKDRKAGKVVNQWTDSSTLSREGNVGHRLDFRLASLRYRLMWDTDTYGGVIQAFELDELPAFFGEWGIGVITTRGVAATHAWIDFPDFAFSLGRPTNYPSRFRFAFLHLDIAYRSLKSFQLGLSLTARLENPILNLPGASR